MVFRLGDCFAAIVALVGVLAAYSWSLWGSPAFGALADQAYHLELAHEFEEAWRDGDFPPRWAAGANGGRGGVGFVVYPPFFALVTACWMRLGASAIDALRLAVLTAAGAAFWAVYYLARGWLCRQRSLLAAVTVLLLPGVTFVVLARGMYPNFAALGWIALLLGAGQRALLGRRARFNAVLVVLAAAGLVLTHTLSAYVLALTLLGILPLLSKILGWRGLARAALLAAAAGALTCWYWLPSLAAGTYTRVDYLAASHPYLDSVFGLSGSTLLDGAIGQDWMFLNDLGRYVVLAQSLLALLLALVLGCSSAAGSRNARRPQSSGLAGKTFSAASRPASDVLFLRCLPWVAGLAFLAAAEPGAWLLLQLPRYELVQFAWRWQLIVALWCGVGLAALPWQRKSLLPAGCAVLVLLAFLPLISASETQPEERRRELPDSVSRQEFEALPALDRAAYAGNLLELRPNRMDERFYLPAPFGRLEVAAGEAEVVARDLRASYRLYLVTAATNTLIRLVTYDAPGWSARLDGREVEIRMDCDGLQLVAMPPGTHRLELQYRAPWPWDQLVKPRAGALPAGPKTPGEGRYCCPCPGGT
jgi:hypothetical protein